MNTLTIAGEVLELDLLSKWAPQTCAALRALGSLSLPMQQSTWCGPTLTGSLFRGALLEVDKLEQPVISLYPGTICLRPVDGRNATYDPMVWAKSPESYNASVELTLAYGYGEFRNETGPAYVTPVAMIRGFNKVMAATIRAAGAQGAAAADFTFGGA
ncbi:hypothetical protein [Aminobacter sp. AP02]|uniref:hypothetical protein n=1 Tax=Aminobacter sp. AP02 TaxID=2135737 RepID=UPI000D795E77|nr:hypothetical protein [Aminobacter sp. AP02]PWK66508.1 hypothetical protein C8K44_114141 [Aminobacter sp. AP02]